MPQNQEKFKFNPPSLGWITAFLIIIVVGFSLDILTKKLAFDYLQSQYTTQKPIIDGFFNLVMRENTGAAWSSFAGQRTMLVSVSIVAFVVVVFIFFAGYIHRRTTRIAVSLFAAGIVGNLYDRIFNAGKVRDFLDFYINDYHWPAFNLADSLLCTAVGLLIITSFLAGKKSGQKTNDNLKEIICGKK